MFTTSSVRVGSMAEDERERGAEDALADDGRERAVCAPEPLEAVELEAEAVEVVSDDEQPSDGMRSTAGGSLSPTGCSLDDDALGRLLVVGEAARCAFDIAGALFRGDGPAAPTRPGIWVLHLQLLSTKLVYIYFT